MKNAPPDRKDLLAQMDRELRARIAQLERARDQLKHLDGATAEAGLDCFESAEKLARWASAPASALGGRTPLSVVRTKKGKDEVISLLMGISQCTFR